MDRRVNQLHRDTRHLRTALSLAIAIGLVDSAAQAGPHGGMVVQGSATIDPKSASVLDINQTSANAVIDWQSFSIGSSEQVNFVQPSATATALNRVTGNQASIVDGVLDANGNVFIINPSGVLFGKSAEVNVGGLVATTSSIASSDFINGQMNFEASALPNSIVENRGQITVRSGGIVALVAPTVRNSGVIKAVMGRIVLAGADNFTIDLYGDRMINFVLPQGPVSAARYEVDQTGQLLADGGRVLISAADAGAVLSSVVNMSGLVRADTLRTGPAGQIILDSGAGDVNVSGTIEASGVTPGGSGGSIDIHGGNIALNAGTLLNASGLEGGGTVSVGVAMSPGETATSRLTMASGATVDASAEQVGSGGTVTLWGTQFNGFYGQILANGGAVQGNGGRIDVSTGQLLEFQGDAQVSASNGNSGVLTLDPANLYIEPIGNTGPIGDISVIAAPRLDALLSSGVNVVLQASNSITVASPIDARSPTSTANPSGQVQLTAGAISVEEPIVTVNAPITVTSTAAGGVTFGGQGLLYVAAGATGAASTTMGTAPITLNSGGNVGVASGSAANAGQLLTAGAVTVDAAGNVTFPTALAGLGSTTPIGSLSINAGGAVQLAGVSSTGAVNITGSGVNDSAAPIVAGTATGPAANVTLTSTGGGITLGAVQGSSSNVGISATGAVTLAGTGSSPVVLNSSIATSGQPIKIGSLADPVANITMASGTSLQTASTESTSTQQSGGISLYTSGAISAQNLITGTSGAVTITATNGDVTLNDAVAGPVATAGAAGPGVGPITITAGGTVQTVGLQANGPISITGASIANSTAPIVTNDGPVVNGVPTPGNVTLTAGSGGITLNDGIDANGTGTVTLAGSTGSAVMIGSNIETNGENITIGTSNPVASITMASGTSLQTASTGSTSAQQSGGISLYASGAISAQNLITGTSGPVTLTATNGDVTLNDAVAGPVATAGAAGPGVGPITITAGGAVQTVGLQANGPISITGASIMNSTAPIVTNDGPVVNGVATPGNVTLTAGSGGITLNAVYATPGPLNDGIDVNGSGTVTLAASTSSAVMLGSNIETNGENITIGTSNPVASITMTPDTSLQTASTGSTSAQQSGGISLYASGAISAQNLITGTSGPVTITATNGDVTLNDDLAGIVSNGNAAGTAVNAAAGTGIVNVSAGGLVQLDGVISTNSITISGAGITNLGLPLYALSGSGNVQLTSAGAITLMPTMDSNGSSVPSIIANNSIEIFGGPTTQVSLQGSGSLEGNTILIGTQSSSIGTINLPMRGSLGDLLLTTAYSTATVYTNAISRNIVLQSLVPESTVQTLTPSTPPEICVAGTCSSPTIERIDVEVAKSPVPVTVITNGNTTNTTTAGTGSVTVVIPPTSIDDPVPTPGSNSQFSYVPPGGTSALGSVSVDGLPVFSAQVEVENVGDNTQADLHRTASNGTENNEGADSVNEDRCPRGAAMLADLGTLRELQGPAANVFRVCKKTL